MSEITQTERLTAPAVGSALPKRLPVRWTLACAAAAVVPIAVAALVLGGGPASLSSPAFAVSPQPSGDVSIKVIRTSASAAEMTRELRAQGLNISINTVTATPQLVGRWVGGGASGDGSPELGDRLRNQVFGQVTEIILPRSFVGQLTLDVAVPAAAGTEPNVVGTPNALAPGGLLFCRNLSGSEPSRVEASLTNAGYKVRWAATQYGATVPSVPRGDRVTAAFIFDYDVHDPSHTIVNPSEVTVTVTSPDAADYAARLAQGFPSGETPTTISRADCPASP
jgi:hypothetical protein